ncbi:MAG TPA: SRPBCC family protein [Anaeromyxobacteraceae bacterium]|nr:SRPBCC family protein [Anaeromyxobacteraceae bacterium]
MAQSVTREIAVSVRPDRLFDVIVDYARYPEFLSTVKKSRPLGRSGATIDVEFELDLGVKTIRYTLRHVEERPHKVTWSLVSGEWMKISNGAWELFPQGEGTRARYTLEVQIAKPTLVPQALVDRVSDELTRIQLPRTLGAFKARAESVAGASPA